MKRIHPLILFSYLLLWSRISFGQNPGTHLKFDHLSIENGLSQSSVFDIIQDSKGFMWFATQDGLNMYDGYKFTVYKHSPKNKNSLSDNNISCLAEGPDSILWIGTRGGGLNKFNPKTRKFQSFIQTADSNSLSGNFIESIAIDKQGNVWIGTDGGGVNMLDVSNGKFKHYIHQEGNEKTISSNRINHVYQDSKGTVWISTKDAGFCRLEIKTGIIKNYTYSNKTFNLPDNWTGPIFEDKQGSFYVSIGSDFGTFDRDKEVYTKFQKPDYNLPVSKIGEDQSGLLWLATVGDGLISFNKNRKSFARYLHNPLIKESLNLDNITALAFDKSGILWLGTFGAGIDKLNLNAPEFGLLQNVPGTPVSLQSKSIRAIYEDRHHQLWIGGYGGLDIIDRVKGQIEHLSSSDNASKYKRGLSGSNIFVIIEDASRPDIVWIGYEGDGFSRFDTQKKEFTHYLCKEEKSKTNQGLPTNFIFAGLDDGQGNIWWGTLYGLSKFNKATQTFTNFFYDANNLNGISHDQIKALYKDHAGDIWIGTNGGGLDKFDTKTNRFTHYQSDPNDPNSISSNRIRSICQDKKGTMWIGTDGGGLNKFNSKTGTFLAFTEKEGLPNDVVYGILEDNHGNLWLSTNKGLCKFNPRNKRTKTFDYDDGLQSNEFNQGAAYKSSGGELFFGGINGVSYFYPDSIKDNSYQPDIVLTAFKKFNTRVEFPVEVSYLDEIHLTYKDQIISFEFSSLDFVAPDKNQYAYMMEGFDESYIHNGNKHEATYTNLDPGEYTFKVIGTNNDGVWNETPTTIKIFISPPWWKTWWFRSSILLAVSLIIIALFKYRVRRIQRQNELLEALVKQRTSELSETNKELEKLSIVARETATGVFITDAKGDVEWFNEGFSKLFGWKSIEEFARKRGRNILQASGHKKIAKLIEESVREKKSITYEAFNPTKDGRQLWIQANLTPIFDEKGELKRLVFVDTDVSELKKAKETAEQSLQIQEQFLANTSHEIRTPMNGIIGMARQLQDTELTPDQDRYVKAINESSNNLLHVVNDILDISKIRAGKIIFEKTEFRLRDLLKTLQLTLQYKAEEKRIYLKSEIDDHLPQVLIGDPVRLNQILLNLAGNAIKFTDTGGVTIKAKVLHEDKNKVKIQFSVQDTGIGIPEEKLDYIFEAFAQAESHTSRKYGGTGLGLSIAKSLIEHQGGKIEVKSEVNKGSIFIFSLELEIGNPNWRSESPSGETFTAKEDLSGVKILLVEDNIINQQVAMFDLKKWKTKVQVAANAMEAFDKLKREPFDIVLMDISMPGMDGLQATRHIRSNMPEKVKDIPVIAMTASALAGEKKKCIDAGMNDYISKPFNPETLYKKIVKWKGGQVIEKETPEPVSTQPLKSGRLTDLSLMMEHAAGSVDYIKDIIRIYLNEMPKYLSELLKHYKEKNWKDCGAMAHKMKSPAALFGAAKLKEYLEEIEISCKNNREPDQITIKQIQDQFNKTVNELQEEMKIL